MHKWNSYGSDTADKMWTPKMNFARLISNQLQATSLHLHVYVGSFHLRDVKHFHDMDKLKGNIIMGNNCATILKWYSNGMFCQHLNIYIQLLCNPTRPVFVFYRAGNVTLPTELSSLVIDSRIKLFFYNKLPYDVCDVIIHLHIWKNMFHCSTSSFSRWKQLQWISRDLNVQCKAVN